MRSDYDYEGSSCPHCGIDMEVIGPPGPIHRAACPRAASSWRDEGPNLTDEEVDFLFWETIGTDFGRSLNRMSNEEGLAALRRRLAQFHRSKRRE